MFSELNNSVDSFSSQLADMRSENFWIHYKQRQPIATTSIWNIGAWICFYNIVHGLLESPDISPSSRATDDITIFNETIKPISMFIPSDSKLFMLGRPNNAKPRPLKIVFPTKEQAINFIIDFNTGKRSTGAENKLLRTKPC